MSEYFILDGKRFVPEQPIFARVRHCSQSPYTGLKRYMTWRGFVEGTGRGDPSVFKYINRSELVYLTKPLQEWIFGLIREASEGTMTEEELRLSWKNLTAWNKAFTNKKGREQGYADYILHVNEGARRGLGCEGVIATGATVLLKGDPYWGRENGGPMEYQDFEVLDVLDPATLKTTWATHWWVIMAATNSVNLDNRKERIDPFPKMKDDRDTPWPLMGVGTTTGTIQRSWLEVLPNDLTKPAYPYMPYRSKGGTNRFDMRNMQ